MTLEILYAMLENIESRTSAIDVLRSQLNQVFDRLDTLEDKVTEMQAAVKDASEKEKVAELELKLTKINPVMSP